MMKPNSVEKFERGFLLVGLIIISFICGILVGNTTTSKQTTRPVEEFVTLDSIVKLNDSVKIVIERINSIKHAKLVEVQSFDNDSTIKLFYELINK